jgi:hypothetical protein
MAKRPPRLLPYPALRKGVPGAKGETFLVEGTAPNEGPNKGRPLRGVNQKTGKPVYERGRKRQALMNRMKG